MATVRSISSADWGSRALQPGLSDSTLARRGKRPEWTQPDDIITGDWTDAAVSMAGAFTETSWIAEWFPQTLIFMVLWSPSVSNLLHLFVIHLPSPSLPSPPPLPICLFHILETVRRLNELEHCQNNKDTLTTFSFLRPTGDSACDLNVLSWGGDCSYICSQMCAQKMFLTAGVCMEQWCWHAGSAVLL